MKITDLLSIDSIEIGSSYKDKDELLKNAVKLMCRSGIINNEKEYLNSVLKREKESTTGVGNGIAIPHGRCHDRRYGSSMCHCPVYPAV
ncbi:MAG: PTS sugar transporter subunit IIA [Erysipelotrichaceae bacterium]|nr:PTS sugar transporter subunit IIA [Erysipelotrichaceae bacterium]